MNLTDQQTVQKIKVWAEKAAKNLRKAARNGSVLGYVSSEALQERELFYDDIVRLCEGKLVPEDLQTKVDELLYEVDFLNTQLDEALNEIEDLS